ncbi:hypothetical protein E2C01_012921 [Portunus trituberculatus]|uniref:Uncharacterized protein n=1 Tax=Portunus trituberculatus TaxID=210409 RepID=A0A5B7DEY5_PORTR|nr:hypothetical protein [Portunus trituberculatus]
MSTAGHTCNPTPIKQSAPTITAGDGRLSVGWAAGGGGSLRGRDGLTGQPLPSAAITAATTTAGRATTTGVTRNTRIINSIHGKSFPYSHTHTRSRYHIKSFVATVSQLWEGRRRWRRWRRWRYERRFRVAIAAFFVGSQGESGGRVEEGERVREEYLKRAQRVRERRNREGMSGGAEEWSGNIGRRRETERDGEGEKS